MSQELTVKQQTCVFYLLQRLSLTKATWYDDLVNEHRFSKSMIRKCLRILQDEKTIYKQRSSSYPRKFNYYISNIE